jgi:hypothetical protein
MERELLIQKSSARTLLKNLTFLSRAIKQSRLGAAFGQSNELA